MKLVIGSKGYSTWSFRPWIALKTFEIAFDEVVIPFGASFKERLSAYTPAGKVPVLIDGAVTIWESLAILEYLAERYPQHSFWPSNVAARAHARSLASEMHAGFGALRRECGMDVRDPALPHTLSDAAKADVARIEAIWRECRAQYGGPFLFSAFSIADAMYAPVVARFQLYDLAVTPETRRYMETIMRLPAYAEWRAAAAATPRAG